MLKFFRSIRKKLIEEDNVHTYLLYAIGEILLVVIGILIALQINNWNEQRKAQEAEQFLLISLKEDFELRLAELKEFKIARKQAIDAIHEINHIINRPETLPEDQKMDSLFAVARNALTFNDQFKTLDMLFSTGMINDLNKEELKRNLIKWPQQVEEMMEEQRARIILNSRVLTPLVMEYVAVRGVNEQFKFRGYNLGGNQPITFESNYKGLIRNPAYERFLANIEMHLNVNEIDSEILIEQAIEISAQIDKELK